MTEYEITVGADGSQTIYHSAFPHKITPQGELIIATQWKTFHKGEWNRVNSSCEIDQETREKLNAIKPRITTYRPASSTAEEHQLSYLEKQNTTSHPTQQIQGRDRKQDSIRLSEIEGVS